MTNWIKAKRQAAEILIENNISKPPIPIQEITENYGIKVIEIVLDHKIAGFIDPEKKIIYINKSDSASRKAFTVAHELGHFNLHQEELKKDPKIGILYRRPLGKKDDDEFEQEANCFAANLLVPFEMLKQYRDEYKKLATVEMLSSLFGVSAEVIRYRLHDLKLENE